MQVVFLTLAIVSVSMELRRLLLWVKSISGRAQNWARFELGQFPSKSAYWSKDEKFYIWTSEIVVANFRFPLVSPLTCHFVWCPRSCWVSFLEAGMAGVHHQPISVSMSLNYCLCCCPWIYESSFSGLLFPTKSYFLGETIWQCWGLGTQVSDRILPGMCEVKYIS